MQKQKAKIPTAHAPTHQQAVKAGRLVTASPRQRHLRPVQQPGEGAVAAQRVLCQLHARERKSGKSAILDPLHAVVRKLQLLQAGEAWKLSKIK